MKVCAIIPAFNESGTIGSTVLKSKKYLDIVFVVDDGSSDNTSEIARENGAQVIRHSQNLGIGPAQQSGYEAAISNGFEFIVQLDGDGQHNPEYIPELLKVASGCDIVIGSRFLNNSHQGYPIVRRIGVRFFTFVVNLLAGLAITDATSGYRVYRVEGLKKLNRLSTRHWAVEQTLEAGKKRLKIKEISIEMPVRGTGKSQFSFATYSLYPLRMIWVVLKVMLFK